MLVLLQVLRELVAVFLQLGVQLVEAADLGSDFFLDGVAAGRQSILVFLGLIFEFLELGNGGVSSVLKGLNILDLLVDDGVDGSLKLFLLLLVRGLAQLLDPVDDVDYAATSVHER